MKTKLIVPFLILFKFATGANNNDTIQISIQFEEDSTSSVMLYPYINGLLSGAIKEQSKIKNLYIFHVPKRILPCELSLQYNHNLIKFEQKILLSNTPVKVSISPTKNSVNWNGSIENSIADNFKNMKDLQYKDIVSFRLASKNNMGENNELNEQKQEYLKMCIAFNQWVDSQVEQYSNYWVSKLWNKEKIPLFTISENPPDQYRKLLTNFSQFVKYDDASILNTSYYHDFLTDYIIRIEILALLSKEPEKELHNKYGSLFLHKISGPNADKKVEHVVKSLYKSIIKSFHIQSPFLEGD